eukprot:1141959-Pelagomonas_calceolata.AAC.6
MAWSLLTTAHNATSARSTRSPCSGGPVLGRYFWKFGGRAGAQHWIPCDPHFDVWGPTGGRVAWVGGRGGAEHRAGGPTEPYGRGLGAWLEALARWNAEGRLSWDVEGLSWKYGGSAASACGGQSRAFPEQKHSSGGAMGLQGLLEGYNRMGSMRNQGVHSC